MCPKARLVGVGVRADRAPAVAAAAAAAAGGKENEEDRLSSASLSARSKHWLLRGPTESTKIREEAATPATAAAPYWVKSAFCGPR